MSESLRGEIAVKFNEFQLSPNGEKLHDLIAGAMLPDDRIYIGNRMFVAFSAGYMAALEIEMTGESKRGI